MGSEIRCFCLTTRRLVRPVVYLEAASPLYSRNNLRAASSCRGASRRFSGEGGSLEEELTRLERWLESLEVRLTSLAGGGGVRVAGIERLAK